MDTCLKNSIHDALFDDNGHKYVDYSMAHVNVGQELHLRLTQVDAHRGFLFCYYSCKSLL